ncbi:hypothetical protein EDB86DRAFT_2828848 [Lactarius hatsudake]|nr:hypothetical protein EDB86DRAFT_2828848 [Lactarius hatsudake]
MPALIPVDNTLGALFIATVLSSRLVDSANQVFVVYTSYHVSVTDFGDYVSNAFKPLLWFLWGIQGSSLALDVSVQHGRDFHSCQQQLYVYPICSESELTPTHVLVPELAIASLSRKVLCDVFITSGMVYYLLNSRTQVRRTNNVLNLLAIYSVNCGTLHLAFAISSVALLAKYPNALIYIPSLFIMYRLSLCAFMAILNSRDNLRERLDGPGGVVATFTQLKVRTGTTVPWGAQDTAEPITSKAVPKSRPQFSAPSDTSFSDSMVAFDSVREGYPLPGPVADSLGGRDGMSK